MLTLQDNDAKRSEAEKRYNDAKRYNEQKEHEIVKLKESFDSLNKERDEKQKLLETRN